MRHPSVLFAPSSLRSFLLRKRQADNALVYLRYAPHRHHRPSPHQPLDLIGVSASRESGAVVCVPIRERNFHAHGSDFTAQWGAALHIPRGREGARAKRASARWGVCKAPTGASPRNPQTSAAQPFCIGNPLQTGKFCSRGPCRCTKFACKSNFYA